MTQVKLRIDIVSDIVCPWCVVGVKRFQQAMQAFERRVEFDIHWQPFELNPGMPQGGQDLREHFKQKYDMSAEKTMGLAQKLEQLGEPLGFHFDHYDQSRMYNTFKAHQLLHWAGEMDAGNVETQATKPAGGWQTALKMRLFSAYFSEQQAVDTEAVLLDAVEAAGLDRTEAQAVLADQRYATVVKDQEQLWLRSGINAVPAVIFNQQYLLLGAQEVETYQTHIEQVLQEIQDKAQQAIIA